MGRTVTAGLVLALFVSCSTPPPRIPADLHAARAAFEARPHDVERLIWYGRRTAYTGAYAEAIAIYSRGIERWPDDARLWRHRGHRQISIRRFDLAEQDLREAARLIESTADRVEPDGMPNAAGSPISSLHSNIWYHLGLALYLQNDLEAALEVYRHYAARATNDDQLVSVTHWLHLTLCRLGRCEEARAVLEPIRREMDLVENFGYHRLCLFYKGGLSEAEVGDPQKEGAMSDAVAYGLAAWHLCHGRTGQGKAMLGQLTAGPARASFGFIAAEADLGRKPMINPG